MRLRGYLLTSSGHSIWNVFDFRQSNKSNFQRNQQAYVKEKALVPMCWSIMKLSLKQVKNGAECQRPWYQKTEWYRNIKPGFKTEIRLKSSVLLDAWVNLGMCREKCKDAGHFPLVEAWLCSKSSGWIIYPAESASKPVPSYHPHQHHNPRRCRRKSGAVSAGAPWS